MDKRILYVFTGVVSILLGVLCVCDSKLTAVLCGIGLLVYGAGEFFHWRERRKAGAAGTWALAGMVVAAAFGLFVLAGSLPGLWAARFLLISLSVWLLAEGVLEILGAIMYRKAMTSADLGVQAPGSVSSMVLGVLMISVGILGLIFPLAAAYAVRVWIVAELIVSGIRLICLARSAGTLERSS